jgi:hypothetical protein
MRQLAICITLATGFTPTSAAQSTEDPGEEIVFEPMSTARESKTREVTMEVGLRGRSLSVPASMLDIWFFDDDAAGWSYTEPRPEVTAIAYGIEFAIKKTDATGVFYFDYIDSNMRAGYWDDQDDPPDHLDGDFLVPSDNLGLAVVGADYYYDMALVMSEKTNGVFGLDLLVGAGLGVGLRTGEIDQWQSDDYGNPAYERYFEGDPSDGPKKFPKVLPILDINAGLRFSFGDRAAIRFEGGLHTMVFWGATTSVMF